MKLTQITSNTRRACFQPLRLSLMPRKATVVGTEAKRVAGMMPEPKKKVKTTSTVTQIFCMVKRLTTGLSIVVARMSRNR